jgi:hypothetical protein
MRDRPTDRLTSPKHAHTALPFLHKTEVFLYPSGLALVPFVLFLLTGLLGEPYRFSATRVMASWYFHK